MSAASKRTRKQRQRDAHKSRGDILLVRAAFVGIPVDKAAVRKIMSNGGFKRLRDEINAREREQYGNTT